MTKRCSISSFTTRKLLDKMTTSNVSPFGGSSASKASSVKSELSGTERSSGPTLSEMVVSFWKAVNCGDSVAASDVISELGTMTVPIREEQSDGKSGLSPSGIDYWMSQAEVPLMFVDKESVCFGKVGQGSGMQKRLCVKQNYGTDACKVSLHKTSRVADDDLLTSGFYVGAPGNPNAVMMSTVLASKRFDQTKVIEFWQADRSFETLKMSPGRWKAFLLNTPVNISKALQLEELKVDTTLEGGDDTTLGPPEEQGYRELLQSYYALEEKITDLEAVGDVYQGMILAMEARQKDEMEKFRAELGRGAGKGTTPKPDIENLKRELREEMAQELTAAVVSLKSEVTSKVDDEGDQGLRSLIFGNGGFAESMEKKMDRLAQQVSGNGVEVGDCQFNCLLDVETWMSSHLKNVEAYGVFWDVVVALCSVPKANVEFDSVMANKKAVEAGKFSSVWNARHFSSFQTTYPPILFTSCNSSGLSAIQYRNKWTSKGQTGIKHDILEGVKRASEALKKEIRNLVSAGSEAAILAEAMHSSSVAFVRSWISEMDSLYEDFVNGGMKGQAAWDLCLLLSKAMFGKLRDARAIALDSTTPSVMLWGSLQAHKVMQEFTHHDFRNHPHFAAVIVQTHILGNSGMNSADLSEPVQKVESELHDFKRLANKKFTDAFTRIKTMEDKRA